MKKYIIMLLTTVFLLSNYSCSDFFDNSPKSQLTEEEVYDSIESIERVVDALFIKWRDLKKDRQGLMFLLGLDETQQGAFQVKSEADQAGLDKYNTALSPDNKALTSEWDNRWLILAQANIAVSVLESFNKETTDEEVLAKNSLMGQAYFIRAALHFEVSQYWGEIPVLDFAVISENGMGRQPLPVVYAQIMKDLEAAVDLLPPTQNDPRRVTQAAAQTLLGKVYMSAPHESKLRDYTKASEYLKMVIDNPKYKLVDNYADLWDVKKPNSVESIYEFQFNNVSPDQNQIQWQTGSRSVANLDGSAYFGGYDLILPTQYAYSSTSAGGVWEDGDLRKNESIRYDFTYKGRTPTVDISWMGGDELDPHIKKYEDIRVDGVMSFWYSGKNVFYLRYADVLLSYAECLNELGQTSTAVGLVNDVRTRAWGGTLPADKKWNSGMSQDQFRKDILDERMRELAFEGWRRIDLLRTGKFVELIKARNKWAKQENKIQNFHQRYPIPSTAMLDDSEITKEDQNPGYN